MPVSKSERRKMSHQAIKRVKTHLFFCTNTNVTIPEQILICTQSKLLTETIGGGSQKPKAPLEHKQIKRLTSTSQTRTKGRMNILPEPDDRSHNSIEGVQK